VSRHAIHERHLDGGLFRIIEKLQPTILVDESDTIFGDKASDHEDLRGLIDAGHRKGVPFIRCHGQDMEPKAFNTFAPVALAGIGNLPATILDRSVIINLRRKSASEVVKPFRLTGDTVAKKRAAVITQRLAQWAETMKILEPMMPDGISDRSADVWEPLIAIADGGGDVWSKDGRDACRVMSGEWAIEDGNDPSLQLLRDLRAVFGESTRMATHSILLALMALPESPWQDIGYGQGLSNVTLAGLLKAYGVKPKSYRNGEKTERGYYRAMFTDLWVRYLGSAEARTSETVTAS